MVRILVSRTEDKSSILLRNIMKITKCPNCGSAVEKRLDLMGLDHFDYLCGSSESFDGQEIEDTHKSWACEEIAKLKKEVAHAEANYWIDRPRFFRD